MKKITIKKFLSTILAVCMITPVFSSCSGQESEKIPEGVEVVLKVSPFNGGYGLGWLNGLKKAYEKKNPKVYISYAANVVDRNAQTTEIYGGIYKNDIYFTGFGYHSALNMYKKQILPLDDVYEKIGDDVITSSVIDWLTYEDGHLYSLPWATAIGGILYHEDYFKANNISIPNTTNELLEVCNQITTLRGTKKTGYPFGYSYEDNYWEYLFNVWFAQYEGLDGYENFFDCVGTNGVQYDKSVAMYTGLLRTLEVYEPLLNVNNQYNIPNSKSDDFTTAQFRFLDKQTVMMVNGDWIIQEMQKGEFDISETKDVCLMKTPIISSIVEKMDLWEEASGVQYTDLSLEKKQSYDDKLSAIVAAVDAGDYDVSLCSQTDYNRIKDVRRVVPSLTNFHNAIVPTSAKYPDVAKDFLAFMYSDEGISIYADSVYGAGLPVMYTDAQVSEIRKESRFMDTMYEQLNANTYFAFNYSLNTKNRAFSQNGLKILNGDTTEFYKRLLATPGTKDYRSSKEIFESHILYTAQYWSEYTRGLV